MSYANGTQFYNLPQTVGTDKRDWFDTNSAFAAIDAALHAAATGQASDAEAIATINGKLATDEADIAALQTKTTTHDSQIAALQTTVNTQANQIADVRQDAEDMITANNEGAAATSTRVYAIGDYFIYNDVLYKATAAIAIGDTIVPNTNCEATNVDTELTQVNNDLTNNNFNTKDSLTFNVDYVTPRDGYLFLSCNSDGDVASGFVRGSNNSTVNQIVFYCDHSRKQDTMFIKKGMHILWSEKSGKDPGVRFLPLTN